MNPNDPYRGRTAPLTSKRCILYIYTTNIVTDYFKHGIYSPFFSSSKCSLFHNSNVFGSRIIHILCTGCAKIKKKFRRQKFKAETLETEKVNMGRSETEERKRGRKKPTKSKRNVIYETNSKLFD